MGKTYILQEFGRREYRQLAFFSLDRDQKAAEVFEKGGSTADMLMALSAISQVDITPNDTLVVLDEIQEAHPINQGDYAYSFVSLKRKNFISVTPLKAALNALILALNDSAKALVALLTKKFKTSS